MHAYKNDTQVYYSSPKKSLNKSLQRIWFRVSIKSLPLKVFHNLTLGLLEDYEPSTKPINVTSFSSIPY